MSFSGLIWVVLLTLTPTFELRASIPYALLHEEWHWALAGGVGIGTNIALAPLVWIFVKYALDLFRRISFIDRLYVKLAEKNARKLRPKVEKYGILGLALFIGVPFPGTGVYSGCLAAHVLEFRFRDYMLASAIGCFLAGVAVTAVVVSGDGAYQFLYTAM